MEFLKQILGEDLYNQVVAKMGDKKVLLDDGSHIPKSRFDEVNNQKNTYKTQNDELNKQLEDLKKANKGNEELTKQINELQDRLKDSETKNKDISLTSAIKMAALKANAKDVDVVSLLVDKTKLELGADGTIKGLDEQLKTLTESKAFLFGETVPPGGGANPPGGGGNDPKPENLGDALKQYYK